MKIQSFQHQIVKVKPDFALSAKNLAESPKRLAENQKIPKNWRGLYPQYSSLLESMGTSFRACGAQLGQKMTDGLR